jgi:hypothetical protein
VDALGAPDPGIAHHSMPADRFAPDTHPPPGGRPLKARAALIAPLLVLAVPASAQASAFIDVNCDRVRVDYHQWESGPPDSSHTSVRVDGGIRFDEVVSFPGSTFRVEVPLNLNDGKPHTIEVKHDWVDHADGSKEVLTTLTCGSAPPADQPPAAPEQPAPVSPPAPAAPATPTAAGGAPAAPTSIALARPLSTAEHAAQRRKARRQRQRAEARRERQRARERATSHRAPRNPG